MDSTDRKKFCRRDFVFIGSLLSLHKPGNGDKSYMEITIWETFFRERLSKQATIILNSHVLRATLTEQGTMYFVKDNKVEVETPIGKVVEFRLRKGYPLFRWLSSVKRVSAWQRVVILNCCKSGDLQEGVWYSVGKNPRSHSRDTSSKCPNALLH